MIALCLKFDILDNLIWIPISNFQTKPRDYV